MQRSSLLLSSLRCIRSHHISSYLLSVMNFHPYLLSSSRLYSSSSAAGDDTIVARCKSLLEQELSPSYLKIQGSNDDPNGSHIYIDCVSSKFEGKNMVQRQRLIYNAIWGELESGRVHAVDKINAKTPSEVAK